MHLKCKVMRISRKRQPGSGNYSMAYEVSEDKHRGAVLQNNLTWDKQTRHVAIKATKVLNFIQRNFHHCSKTAKSNLHFTLI